MGYIAVLIGFAVLVTLCMLNVHIIIASFAAAVSVTVLAGLPFKESLVTVYFTRFGTITGTMLPMFLFGAILAKIYSGSGAAATIADTICNALFKHAHTEKSKYT